MKNLPFDAIIFDHDGTLVDTERPDLEACQMLCQELGIELPLNYWAKTVAGHMNGYNTLHREIIQPHHAHFTAEDMWQRLRELWAITLKHTRLMPGVQTVLPQLQASGYRLGVATASDRNWADRWLTHFNLYPFFGAVATGDDVPNNKPAPDVYLHAAHQLGVQPQRCLVFEDTVAGLTSAKAAGMTVVAAPGYVTEGLDFSQADRIIDGLNVVTPRWIETLSQSINGNL